MRLLAYANARRVLFLVDRRNLSTQTKNEFQRFTPPGTGKLFPEVYNVQLLSGRTIIGLTATPSKHTLGFFHRNLVSQSKC